jgi:hypothetical protein
MATRMEGFHGLWFLIVDRFSAPNLDWCRDSTAARSVVNFCWIKIVSKDVTVFSQSGGTLQELPGNE